MGRVIVFLIAICSTNLYSQKKYNVVWLVAEDQSSQFFPMYGDETMDLPALQSLASESIIYDNAFATVPVCAPARSSIILGMYPIKVGTHNMRTYNAYRKDNEPTIGIHSYSPVAPLGAVEFPKYLRAEGYYCTNNAKEDYNMKITDGTWDESSNEAHWNNRSSGQPFFSVFNFNESHESGIWKFGDKELQVDPKEVKVPPYFPDDSIVRHDLAVNYGNLKRIDERIQVVLDQLKASGLYDDTFIFFYGDHGGPFPRHKRSLRDTGLKVPFFVKLPREISEGMTRSEELVSFVDLAPTLLSIAGIKKPEHMQGRAFLGQFRSQEKVDFIFSSSDRYDANPERSRAVRSDRYKLIRNYRPDQPYALAVTYREQMQMMRRLHELDDAGKLKGDAALWMRKKKDSLEFFDLYSDPFELNNLYGNPYYAGVIDAHIKALDSWQEENNDQGQTQEKELIQKWESIAAQTKLEAPKVWTEEGKVKVENVNRLGNIIYKKDSETVWRPFKEGILVDSQTKFKVVHIGLQDSDVSVL